LQKLENLRNAVHSLTIRVLGLHCCRVLNFEELDGIQQRAVGGVEEIGIENDGRGVCEREVLIQPISPDIDPIVVKNVGEDGFVTGSSVDPELSFRFQSHGGAELREVEGQVRFEAGGGRLVECEGDVV
jgi:hypothetical protein